MPPPPKIAELVDAFALDSDRYLRADYPESQARNDFITPFFAALGWEMQPRPGVPLDLRDVIVEEKVRARRTPDEAQDASKIVNRHPDYTFRIDGKRRFFVEAKKPSRKLREDSAHALQVRTYGWNAQLPVSILTDFEEFAVYDCRIPPKEGDTAQVALLPDLYLTYDKYLERWDEIYALFSREAVAAGSLDKYVEQRRVKAGTQTVDKAFLAEISRWRELLAADIHARNPDLPPHLLNYAVQMTINRIIFLRICEDRGIEREERLQVAVKEGEGVYPRLVRLFREADQRYNSGLFHFRDEHDGRSAPETFTLEMQVGDEPLRQVIEKLYYPNPYRFNVIPIEILGQVYEQFLGKVIRLAPLADDGRQTTDDSSPTAHRQTTDDSSPTAHRRTISGGPVSGPIQEKQDTNSTDSSSVVRRPSSVIIEEKPEVRKAGGVYYTPSYIVDYIVGQTVGKLVEGKRPDQVAGLRVLDPACGSGSFLIGAYSYLLDWYLRWYADPANDPDALASKRKDRPIERVTLPPDGGDAGARTTYRLTLGERKRILLRHIYGVDIDTQAVEVTKLSLLLKVLEGDVAGEAQQLTLGLEEQERVLPDLGKNIKAGNSLIGPDFYESGQASFLTDDEERRINVFDWHAAFPEIMKASGFDAVIGNPPWGADFSEGERAYLVSKYPSIPTKTKDSYMYFTYAALKLLRTSGLLGFIVPNTWLLINYAKTFRDELLSLEMFEIIDHGDGVFLQATVESATVLVRNMRSPFAQCHAVRFRKGMRVVDQLVDKRLWLSDEYHRIIIDLDAPKLGLLTKLGTGASRFGDLATIIWGIKPYQVGYGIPPQTRDMVEKRIYHAPEKNGDEWKPLLVGSDVNRFSVRFPGNLFIRYGKWLMYPSNEQLMQQPKILLRQTSDILRAGYDEAGYYCQNSVFIISSATLDLKYLLALLNSKLLGFAYKMGNPQTGKVFAEIKPSVIKQLPIRTINFTDPTDKARHDRMVQLVEQMLDLHKRLASEKSPHERERLQTRISHTDRQIDRLVYDLYGLTEEEIAIVEGTSG